MKALIGFFVIMGALVGGVCFAILGPCFLTITGALFWVASSFFLVNRYFNPEAREGAHQEAERKRQLNPWDII